MTNKIHNRISQESLTPRTYLDGEKKNRPLSREIVRGTIYAAKDSKEHAQLFQKNKETFYQRFGHPSENDLAEKFAALEGAETSAVFASGMAAISTSLLAHLPPGCHVVAGNQIFEQTNTFLQWLADDGRIEVTFVDTRDIAAVKAAIKPSTHIVYIETPSNPTLRITDIRAMADIADKAGSLLFVDGTFGTPMSQLPLELGASLVLHSGTKLINGHMDAMCGLIAGPYEIIEPIKKLKRLLGGVLDPQASWLVQRGIKTLHVRASRIYETSLFLAQHLEASSTVSEVRYPMLESHEGYEIARRQMSAGGGIVSFSLNGGVEQARRFIDALDLIQIASSLGGVETVVELPNDLDWFDSPQASASGIDAGLIRLSVGLENVEELKDDLTQALARTAKK